MARQNVEDKPVAHSVLASKTAEVTETKEASGGKSSTDIHMTKDEYALAQLGYKQTFFRGLGILENFIATFTTMNFVSGMPVLFGFAMYTGGPQAALANWAGVGGMAVVVSLTMAEIAAALPTAGGIYYWLVNSQWKS